MVVFELAQFPGLIIKACQEENGKEVLENLNRCLTVVKEHSLDCCMIPSSELVELPNSLKGWTLFCMIKVKRIHHESKQASFASFKAFKSDVAKQKQ